MYVLRCWCPCGDSVFFVLVEFTQCPQSSPIYDTKAKSSALRKHFKRIIKFFPMEAARLLCFWLLVCVKDTVRENEWNLSVHVWFAAFAFCSMYSCYMSVFLSQTAAVSNTTSCLSEWCSLCHKYFIMPLGICPRHSRRAHKHSCLTSAH